MHFFHAMIAFYKLCDISEYAHAYLSMLLHLDAIFF